MKDYDDELKELFQKKNLENAFSPDEQNWMKMASVLKKEQKVKRKFLYYLSSLLLLTGSVGIIYFTATENGTTTLAVASQKVAEKDDGVNVSAVPAEFVAKEKKGLSESPQDTKVNQQLKVTPDSEISASNTASPEAKQNILDKAPEDETANEEKGSVVKKYPTQKNQFEFTGVDPEKSSALHGSSDEAVLEETPQTKSVALNRSTFVENVGEGEGGQPLHAALQSGNKEDNGALKMPEVTHTEDSPEKEAMKPESGSAENEIPNSFKADVLAMIDLVLPVQNKDSALKGTDFKVEIPSIKTMLSRRVSMELGTNYLFGWKTHDQREAAGFNPLIGLQYYHEVNKKVALSIGIQYSSISHLSHTSHTSTTTRLKFGEEIDATVISALNIHYLYAPLKINYRFNRNNSIGLGYTLAYLLNAESRVETYSTRLDYASTPVVSKAMGYTSGFNPYDGQVALSYRRRIYNQWYVNAEFYYGLFDIKNNAVYRSTKFERTSGFKLSLGINLWKNN